MGLFNFSIDDLKANRAGNVTPRQTQLLRDKLTDKWWGLGCFPVLMAAVCMCAFIGQRTTGKEQSALNDAGILAIGIGGILLVIVISVYWIRQSRAEIASPKIESVNGNIQLYVIDAGKSRAYSLIIAHMDFDIKPSLYTGLAAYLQQKGRIRSYKVYYTERSKTILSIE